MEGYYDPSQPGSFGGINALARATRNTQRATKNWLSGQLTYTLHKPARKRFSTRPYRTNKIDAQWQGDLVEMIPYANLNDGYRYLLTIIDLFSRHAWAVPTKTKNSADITRAFTRVLDQGRKPKILQTDNGKEFENREFQHMLNEHDIKFFTVKSQFKAAVVERFNRTLKAKMWRYFTYTASHRWLEVLPQLMQSYNSSIHRSIGMAPNDVNNENEIELWEKQQSKGPQLVTRKDRHTLFKVGDSVRISKAKRIFDKGYLPNWTEEIFTITHVIKTPKINIAYSGPTQYKIKDYKNEVIEGAFYGFELQKIQPPELYRIEEVLRQRTVRGQRQYFVKWMGYGPEFNSWVTDIENFQN
jgi:transposase InsO family protein